MSLTIRDIATAAGVSRGTVDRVLHDRPGVRPDVAEHVRAIAKELGFRPNRAGKILAAKKQPLKVGCFLPGVGNPFFEEVVAGFLQAQRELEDFGVSVEIRQVSGYDEKAHLAAIEALLAEGCQALCVSTVDTPAMRAHIEALMEEGVPVIATNTDLSSTRRLCYVGCDYTKAGATAAGLLALTRSDALRLLIVTGSLRMKGHNQRIQGFSRTLREKGSPYHLYDAVESLDNDLHAYAVTRAALCKYPEINSIYIVAAGVSGVCRAVLECREKGQVTVISHDEVSATRALVADGVISFTIGQEPFQQGLQSVHLLFEYFVSGQRAAPPDFITKTVIRIQENLD